MEDKRVMLFSGGMDSFCMAKMHYPNILLTFELGTKDNAEEIKQVNKIIKDKVFNNVEFIHRRLDLSNYELENKIIPHRNTMLCLLASSLGNKIYIGATAGDSTKDKDYVFKSQVEGMLNYFGQDRHKVAHQFYPYSIEMPFKSLTKTQILRMYLYDGHSIDQLLKYSRSCYKGGDKECGTCRSCLRKAIALVNNGILYRKVFKDDPFDQLTQETIDKMKSRDKEGMEFCEALGKLGGMV